MRTQIIFKEPVFESIFWGDFVHPQTRGFILSLAGFLVQKFSPDMVIRITHLIRKLEQQIDFYLDDLIAGKPLGKSAHFLNRPKYSLCQAVDFTTVPVLSLAQEDLIDEWANKLYWKRSDGKLTLRPEHNTGTALHLHCQFPQGHVGYPELTGVQHLEVMQYIKKLETEKNIVINPKLIFFWENNL